MFICRLIILFYFSSTYFSVCAQNSKLIFTSKANLFFKISINNINQHIDFTNDLTIIRVTGEQNYSLQVTFKNDTLTYKQIIYVIDENATQFYEVTSSKVILKKIITGAYLIKKAANKTVVPFSETIINSKDTLVVIADSLVVDTSYKIPFENYYKMPDYKGKIGCPWPLKNEKLIELKLQLQQLSLDDRKLETVKRFKENTLDFCLTMEQTSKVTSMIELDENKIELVKFLYLFIYDQENLLLLKPSFNYENSYDELKAMLGKN